MKIEIERRHSDYGEDAGGYAVLKIDGIWIGRIEGKDAEDKIISLKNKLSELVVLIVECRDALPAITLGKARLHNVKLDLADRIKAVLKPWEVPKGTPGSF